MENCDQKHFCSKLKENVPLHSSFQPIERNFIGIEERIGVENWRRDIGCWAEEEKTLIHQIKQQTSSAIIDFRHIDETFVYLTVFTFENRKMERKNLTGYEFLFHRRRIYTESKANSRRFCLGDKIECHTGNFWSECLVCVLVHCTFSLYFCCGEGWCFM